jgi:hypothetical protein
MIRGPQLHPLTIIIFNLIIENHVHHLQEMFRKFKEHNIKLHFNKFNSFTLGWNT